MKAKVNSEFDLTNIRSGLKTCCNALHLERAAENQLRICAPVANLSDKCAIFRLFAFNRKALNFDEYRIRQWPIFERREIRIQTSSHP